jgi:hypothetical protein
MGAVTAALGGRYGRLMGFAARSSSSALAVVVGGLIAALTAASFATAATPLPVPNFLAGPLLSGGTLVWQDASGLEALSPGGRQRMLLRHGTLSEVSVGGGWIALDTGRRLDAGRASGTLRSARLPRGCLPLPAAKPPSAEKGSPRTPLFGISGERLFLVVGSSCAVGQGAGAGIRLVMFDARGRYLGLRRKLSRRPYALAVAGGTIALFDAIVGEGVVTLTVLSGRGGSARARTVTRRTLGGSRGQPRFTATEVQVDQEGDALATELYAGHFGPEVSGAAISVDGEALLPDLRTIGPFSGLPIPARPIAALSNGRLAFFTGTEDNIQENPSAPTEEIEVLDLDTDKAVAKLYLAADNVVLGIALAGDDLTWIQQPLTDALGPPTQGSSLPTCEFGSRPIGPAMVESINIVDLLGSPITVGEARPPAACTGVSAAPP